METSKIKSIDKTDNTWTGQSGTMYDYTISLEDGTEGTAASPNPEKPPYSVGDEVEYNKTVNNWGTKLKIKKAGGFEQRSQSPDIQRRIDASWAIGHALAQSTNPEDVLEIAESLLNMRNTLISKL
tara:strand:+ start:294 stop:671 length:378 start_codon:yes stop_codon:yes gene_type:complete